MAQYLHVHVIAESNAKEANRDSERVVRLCYYQTSIIRMGGGELNTEHYTSIHENAFNLKYYLLEFEM